VTTKSPPTRILLLWVALLVLCASAPISAQSAQVAPVELPVSPLLRGKEVRDSIYHAATASRIVDLESRLAAERHAREEAEAGRGKAELDLLANRRSHDLSLGIGAVLLVVLIAIALYWKRTEATRSEQQWGITDPLTGAKNRRYFEQTIAADMAVCARRHVRAASHGGRAEEADLVFLLFDLDHFKEINDQHGHMVGDEVLKQVVAALEEVCRQSDVVCRWGGEEFLVVGRFTDRALAPMHAERIRKRVESCEIALDGRAPLHVTCSVGYASYPLRVGDAGQEGWHQIIALADQATYMSKRGGRNRCTGLLAGPQAEMIGSTAVSPDAVKRWIAEDALILEKDAGRGAMVAAR
jgi:diguanylate cyclase (GGDEF)-like protein